MKFVIGLVSGTLAVLVAAGLLGYPAAKKLVVAEDVERVSKLSTKTDPEPESERSVTHSDLPQLSLRDERLKDAAVQGVAPEQVLAAAPAASELATEQSKTAGAELSAIDVRLTPAHAQAANAWRENLLFDESQSGPAQDTPAAPVRVDLADSPQALPSTGEPRSNPEPATVEEVVSTANPVKAQAVAWKPFHSQVSAAGFARRLSTQLGFPFRTVRTGPANYQVVFDYSDPAERELLEQQITSITGYAP